MTPFAARQTKEGPGAVEHKHRAHEADAKQIPSYLTYMMQENNMLLTCDNRRCGW